MFSFKCFKIFQYGPQNFLPTLKLGEFELPAQIKVADEIFTIYFALNADGDRDAFKKIGCAFKLLTGRVLFSQSQDSHVYVTKKFGNTNFLFLSNNKILRKQLIEANYDYNDTTGKSYEAAVGWITNKWRDPYVDPEDADFSEYWEDYDYEMEEEDGS